MGKKKDRKKKVEAWVDDWCKEHVGALIQYRSMVVTLHPTLGIVNAANNIELALIQEQHLRRSIASECYHVGVDAMLEKLGWDDPLAAAGIEIEVKRRKPKAPKPEDDFPVFGPAQPPTVKTGPKDDEDQAPVPEDPNPPPPLSPAIDPFDNDILIDGANNPSAFASPDKQPPFMPRMPPRSNGSVRLDGVSNPGARGSWSGGRGPRYD